MFRNKDKLLHTVMEEICSFAEKKTFKQYPNDMVKSLKYLAENTKELKYEYKELYAIYVWYKQDRPKRELPKEDIGVSMMYYEQDTKMLSRAVALRKFFRGLFKGGDYEPSIKTYQATQKSITKGRNVGKREITS